MALPTDGSMPSGAPFGSDMLPVVERRSRRPLLVRLLRATAIVVLVTLIAAPTTALLLLLPREPVEGLASSGSPFGPPLHILITGSDSRADLSAEERIALTTGSAGGERTDTIMLLTIDGPRAGLLSFPRDLSVQRCDGSIGRINGAIAIGGAT